MDDKTDVRTVRDQPNELISLQGCDLDTGLTNSKVHVFFHYIMLLSKISVTT